MLETLTLCLHITHRNWMVYRKDLLANISPTFADPAFTMLSLGLGLGTYLNNVEGMSYMKYLAPGLAVSTALFTSFFESSYGFFVRMNYDNVFQAMLTTPIGVPEIVLGEMIWVGIKGAIMSTSVAIVLSAFGLMANPILIPLIGLIGFLVALPCGAMGLLATAMVHNINQFQTVYSFIIAPLYFLSGIFFPISKMHPVLKILAEFFPLIHGVRLSQAIFWNEDIFSVMISSGSILIIQCFIYCGLAYFKIKKKLIN
ncbi:MAG: ABC transporter permease [Bacteriovoracaceae bacterium]